MQESENVEALSFHEAHSLVKKLHEGLCQVIFGQEELITETLCTFLAAGHALITGAPGLAKTTLVRVFAEELQIRFGRVQFTPDLLPSDILGAEILNWDAASNKRSFEFVKGPIFVGLLLADEINRASPRTQSAMLEAMQERQVTVGGKIYPLPFPFMVFATQNPFEAEGTFPLPEAQLDRFLLHALVSYPDEKAELRMLTEHTHNTLGKSGASERSASGPVTLSTEHVHGLLQRTKQVAVPDEILALIKDLVRSTRPEDPSCPAMLKSQLWYGAGPRAGLALVSVCKAIALLEGEESVRWRHIQRMAAPVLRHRVRLIAHADSDLKNEDLVVSRLLADLEEKHVKVVKGLS